MRDGLEHQAAQGGLRCGGGGARPGRGEGLGVADQGAGDGAGEACAGGGGEVAVSGVDGDGLDQGGVVGVGDGGGGERRRGLRVGDRLAACATRDTGRVVGGGDGVGAAQRRGGCARPVRHHEPERVLFRGARRKAVRDGLEHQAAHACLDRGRDGA